VLSTLFTSIAVYTQRLPAAAVGASAIPLHSVDVSPCFMKCGVGAVASGIAKESVSIAISPAAAM
jgi:hypothetical protein